MCYNLDVSGAIHAKEFSPLKLYQKRMCFSLLQNTSLSGIIRSSSHNLMLRMMMRIEFSHMRNERDEKSISGINEFRIGYHIL